MSVRCNARRSIALAARRDSKLPHIRLRQLARAICDGGSSKDLRLAYSMDSHEIKCLLPARRLSGKSKTHSLCSSGQLKHRAQLFPSQTSVSEPPLETLRS
jgi:hypothetical protein